MIRVTPDTNVLISALFYDGNERYVLKSATRGEVRFILSLEIIDELIRVLGDKFGVDWQATRDYVLRLCEIADIVRPRRLSDLIIRDRKDAKVIECALSGQSEFIVTGDEDLLSLNRYGRIKILPTSKLVSILKSR